MKSWLLILALFSSKAFADAAIFDGETVMLQKPTLRIPQAAFRFDLNGTGLTSTYSWLLPATVCGVGEILVFGAAGQLICKKITGASSGLTRVGGTARIQCDADSQVLSDPTGMISNITDRTGTCTVTFTNGFFQNSPYPNIPHCTLTDDNSNNYIERVGVAGPNNADVAMFTTAGSDVDIDSASLDCWEYR